jgi:hypothetical protein
VILILCFFLCFSSLSSFPSLSLPLSLSFLPSLRVNVLSDSYSHKRQRRTHETTGLQARVTLIKKTKTRYNKIKLTRKLMLLFLFSFETEIELFLCFFWSLLFYNFTRICLNENLLLFILTQISDVSWIWGFMSFIKSGDLDHLNIALMFCLSVWRGKFLLVFNYLPRWIWEIQGKNWVVRVCNVCCDF